MKIEKVWFEHIFIATQGNWDWAQVQKLRSPSPYTSNLYIEIKEVHKNMKMKCHECNKISVCMKGYE